MNRTSKHPPQGKRTVRLEALWDDLLSRHPRLIRQAFDALDPTSQAAVIAHLQNMQNDAGWQPEQRASAKSALKVLTARSPQEE